MLTAAGDLALVADRPQFEGLPLLSVSLTVVVLVLMPIIWRRPQLCAWLFSVKCALGFQIRQVRVHFRLVSGFSLPEFVEVPWSCLFGVDGGQLVTNWLVPVSSFGLSGLMRIAQWEEMKTSLVLIHQLCKKL